MFTGTQPMRRCVVCVQKAEIPHMGELQHSAPKAQFVDATDLFDEVRSIKSEEELQNWAQ